MKEFARIAAYLAPLVKGTPEALGLLDDAALIPGPDGLDYAITKDAIVEGIHFFTGTEPGLIAKKLLRTNLSDMAAMGAKSRYFLISAALPASVDDAWYKAFSAALAEEQTLWNIQLIGGDTVSIHGPLTLSLTMLGEVPHGTALKRSGAKAGDAIYVSGNIGDAALGLALLNNKYTNTSDTSKIYLINRYHIPQPRVELAIALRGIASAAIDISDGLMADLGHICHSSGVAATIHADHLPLSEAARKVLREYPEALSDIATGGDDYEVLFTVPPDRELALTGLGTRLCLPVARVGQLREGRGVVMLDSAGEPVHFPHSGWQHGS